MNKCMPVSLPRPVLAAAWLSAITIVWGLAASVRHLVHAYMHACF
jgi:hypothetical protein